MSARPSLVRLLFALCALSFVVAAPKSASAQTGICNADALRAALAAATPGTTVQIGACRIDGGNFTVNAGVRVEGQNSVVSSVEVPVGMSGFIVRGGAGTSSVAKLRIGSDGLAAIVVDGSGAVALENLVIQPRRGVGIAGDVLPRLHLGDVTLEGPLPATVATTFNPLLASPTTTAVLGIALASVSNLTMNRVSASGFANGGIIVTNSGLAADRIDVSRNFMTGMTVWGGRSYLDHSEARNNFKGLMATPAAGFAFLGGAEVSTDNLSASENVGYGVFHDHTTMVEHDGATVVDNTYTGIYVNASQYVQLDNVNAWSNWGAGILAIDTTLLSIDNAHIRETHLATIGGAPIGDGILAVRTLVDIDQAQIQESARAGVLVELASGRTTAELLFNRLHVRGGLFGVIVQSGSLTYPMITLGITRTHPLELADAMFGTSGTPLPVSGNISPEIIPLPARIAASGVGFLVGSDGPIGGPGGDPAFP